MLYSTLIVVTHVVSRHHSFGAPSYFFMRMRSPSTYFDHSSKCTLMAYASIRTKPEHKRTEVPVTSAGPGRKHLRADGDGNANVETGAGVEVDVGADDGMVEVVHWKLC